MSDKQSVILAADERTITGKKVSQLRADGKVPAVIYDHGKSTHITVDARELQKAFQAVGRSQPLEIEQNGKKRLAMVKIIDWHPVRHDFRHIAFQAIRRNEKVNAEVSIHMKLDEDNESTPAERNGLVVLRAMDSVEIRALPKDLPEELTVNGEDLHEVGDRLTLANITLPEGVEFADQEIDLEQVIANVYEPSAIAAANEEAGGDSEEAIEEAEGVETPEEAVDADHGEDTNQASHDAEMRPGGKETTERPKDQDEKVGRGN